MDEMKSGEHGRRAGNLWERNNDTVKGLVIFKVFCLANQKVFGELPRE